VNSWAVARSWTRRLDRPSADDLGYAGRNSDSPQGPWPFRAEERCGVANLYITGAVTVAFAGQFSIDHALGVDTAVLGIAVVVIPACGVWAALGCLAVRQSPELAGKSS
jgi:hypothetical protein